MSHFVLGVTGASGSIYATRTAMYLQRFHHEVTLIVTHPGKQVLEYEGQSALFDYCKDVCNVDDFFAECASGSSDIAGMAVVPCSMGTLGRIAAGTSWVKCQPERESGVAGGVASEPWATVSLFSSVPS